jgi:hypothetical protein
MFGRAVVVFVAALCTACFNVSPAETQMSPTDDPQVTESCFSIPDIVPGAPEVSRVQVRNGYVQMFTSRYKTYGYEVHGPLEATGGLPAGAEDKAVYSFFGKCTMSLPSGSTFVFDGQSSDPMKFVLLKGRGFVYLEGEGEVTLSDGKIVKLPCPPGQKEAAQQPHIGREPGSADSPDSKGEDEDYKTLLRRVLELDRAGQRDSALVTARRAVVLAEKNADPNGMDYQAAQIILAKLYTLEEQYEQAETLYKSAIERLETTLGPDDPTVGTNVDNLAGLYRRMERYAESESLYVRSLAISEKHYGPDHLDAAYTLNNLGVLYEVQGRYEEAEDMFKHSLAIREKALGPNHPAVANCLRNLAAVYRDTNRDAEADALEERASKIDASHNK